MNLNELSDKIALRELIDNISIYGDKKDFKNQVQFFTENALSETIAEGKTILRIEGRNEMAKAFAKFNKDVETLYHFNGQQIVSINGDLATGKCYCLITLIGEENGKNIKTTIGATYEDDYVRTENQWLVSKRVGTFEWKNTIEIVE
ncbi:nuclear transport factor 2 family protein [Fulvivirga maritima]|uniref:nuclear transport factor 2 family protein n=1 Tax=Fulvivirga maritima TaxID=2904247 RepID=UPI001F21F121|nr:nuclear transport factor 2 family protein [Fulvivirga maritima]UII25804.1 nuclear transport factor 2 family protein [Fulvivirga maritima]